MKIQVPSGLKVNVQIHTTSGVTYQYVKWGGYAIQGALSVDGPYYDSINAWSCSTNNLEDLYVRVYCSSSECRYSVTLTQTWAVQECGMIWQEQALTACDSSCRQNSQAKCYYGAYSQLAPSTSICTAGLGVYVPTVTVCPIDASCGVDSVCRGPYPNTCVNLCSNVNCRTHGTCQVKNAQAVCLCNSCYSGAYCDISPTGSWVNKSWSECDCDEPTQTRKVTCETSFGCVLSNSYCPGDKIENQNCSSSCSFTLETMISEAKGNYFYVVLFGGPSIFLVCCMCWIIKCRTKKDERYLKIHIPTAAPDPIAISIRGSPSHSKNLQTSHHSFPSSRSAAPSLSSSNSLSRPGAPSLVVPSFDHSRTSGIPRPMTPSRAESIPEESGRFFPAPSAPQSNTEIEVPEYLLQRPPSPFSPEYDEKTNNSPPHSPSAPQPATESAVSPPYLSQRPDSPFSPEYAPPSNSVENPIPDSSSNSVGYSGGSGYSGYNGGYGGGDIGYGGGYSSGGGNYTGGDY